jgi:hypothetical protein
MSAMPCSPSSRISCARAAAGEVGADAAAAGDAASEGWVEGRGVGTVGAAAGEEEKEEEGEVGD